MSYLLDSHTFLWALLDPKKLSAKVARVLEDTTHQVFISSVNLSEICFESRMGKRDLTGIAPEELSALAHESGCDFLPLTAAEGSTYHLSDAGWHRDPFDRMLSRQALTHHLTLLSKDK